MKSLEKIKKVLYTAVISDVLDEMGYNNQALEPGFLPLLDDSIIAGTAFTAIATEVYESPKNPLVAQCRVVDQMKKGEIFVLATRGNCGCALFGELFATNLKKKGCDGIVIDGGIRDIAELKKMKFPTFYEYRDIRSSKGRAEINECKGRIKIKGVSIDYGDFIFADSDGVVIIPKAIKDEVIDRAFELVEKENKSRELIENGASMESIYNTTGAL